MKILPQFLEKYFWDVEFKKLNIKDNGAFVIERILECGDKKAVNWMRDNFKPEKIKKVLCDSKNLSQKSANFWQLIFDLKRDKILCLKKSFQKKQRALWKP